MRKAQNIDIQIVALSCQHSDEVYDGKLNYSSAFMKVSLLYRDIVDAYKMGDGSRVFHNIKFIMLHFDRGHHIKYR